MTIDIARARADTPGTTLVNHLNNAGASLPPRQVTDTVVDYLRRESLLGGYETAAAVADDIERVHALAAALIGAQPDEIALTDSASRAWDIAFQGMRLRSGDRVLVDRARYPGHAMEAVQAMVVDGVVIEVVDDDASGQLDVADLARRMAADVRLVALTHVPTDSGLVNPIAAAGRVCRDAGVPMLLDACQSVGQLVLDVDDLGCDLLTATGRKFLRGPRGTGFLYVRSSLLDRLQPVSVDTVAVDWAATTPGQLVFRHGAARFEAFERSVAGVLGLGAAIEYAASHGMPAIQARILDLGAELRQRLSQIGGVAVDRRGETQCGIVTFTVESVPSTDVARRLLSASINTSITRPVPALTPDGTVGPARVRASAHYYNTLDEIDALCAVVAEIAGA